MEISNWNRYASTTVAKPTISNQFIHSGITLLMARNISSVATGGMGHVPVFQLLDNSANKHAKQPMFFSCFTSGSRSLAKYTKICMVWQPNIRNML